MRRLLAGATVVALALILAGPAATRPDDGSRGGVTYAVIGDTPYGATELAAFPGLVAAINADREVELTLHLGDIKSGSSVCSDAYFAEIRSDVDAFRRPFVYTPGDNEWTDCHRSAAGGYLPTERLAAIRSLFFPRAESSLGKHRKRLGTQADEPGFAPFVENRLWKAAKVVFATVHVVGSNNDLAPWFGAAETPEQKALQEAEYQSRLAAALAWIDEAFDRADDDQARGVVIAMQADMWDGTPDGFREIVQELATRSAAFGKPVLLLEGDSHVFTVDQPLATGSAKHGVATAAPNLTRVVVQGATAVHEYLRLTIDPNAAGLFSWERVNVP